MREEPVSVEMTGRDDDFIAGLRRHDEGAVAELLSTYRPKVVHLALRYLRNREDAEEVAQDVLIKVYQKIPDFRGESALSSWIYRITFNTVMSRLRSARSQATVMLANGSYMHDSENPSPVDDAPDRSDLADERLLRRQMRDRLARAVRALPPMYRVPIILRDLKGLSTEQASRLLSVKDDTFKSRLHRGRLMLRRQLADIA